MTEDAVIKRWFSSEIFAGILIFIGLAVFVLSAVLFVISGHFHWLGKIDPEVSAQLGDLIGGVVGAIWALAGVILFYRALVKEKETTSQLQFNDTFFHLFNLYTTLIANMKVEVSDGKGHMIPKIGIDCFEHFHTHLRSTWEREMSKDEMELKKSIDNAVHNLVHHNKNNLIRYVGIIESLLKYLDAQKGNVKNVHLDLLRGSISSFERSFLFYYAVSNHCSKEMKALIVEFKILLDNSSYRFLKNEHYHLLYAKS